MAATALYEAIQWTIDNGEPKALDRLRVKCLPALLEDGVMLAAIEPETTCSPETLAQVVAAATDVVGEACPV